MTQPKPSPQGEFEAYDAGLINDFGGGDVGWWQDYIRAELGRAHDFYERQSLSENERLKAEVSALRAALEAVRDYRISADPPPDMNPDTRILIHVGRLRTMAILGLARAALTQAGGQG